MSDLREAFLEEIYVLIKNLNFTYHDVYNMPVWKRRWFLNKFSADLKKQVESNISNNNNVRPSRNNNKRIFKQ